MSKTKIRLITIVSLVLMLCITLSMAIAALPFARGAFAAGYEPDGIFSAGTNGDVGSSSAEEGEKSWTQLTFHETASNDTAQNHYRRSLALKWFEAADKPEDPSSETVTRANPGVAKYLNMTFAFPALDFESFEILFTSAEENITKDGTATNALYFEVKGSALSVAVKDASFDRDEDDVESLEMTPLVYVAGQDITLALDKGEHAGEFAVSLTIGEGEPISLDPFTNIGGNYIEYRSTSSSTPQTPMTFIMNFAAKVGTAAADQDVEHNVLVKSLNGQTLEVVDGTITDNAYPVLVLDKELYAFRLGRRFSLTYTCIDVCDESVTPTRQYYMLKTTEKEDETDVKVYHRPTDSDYKSISTNNFLMPTSEDEEFAYVSIRFRMTDDNHSTPQDVYLSWYAAEVDEGVEPVVKKFGDAGETVVYNYKCKVCGKEITKETYDGASDSYTCTGKVDEEACTGTKADYEAVNETNYFDYIRVDLEAKGPSFINVKPAEGDLTEEEKVNVFTPDEETAQEAFNAYQDSVNQAAEGVSAGDGAYFYLPSLRDLIKSDYADYRDLTFSIYYQKPHSSGSASSATSLSYNGLRIEVDEWGPYRFRVIAQDSKQSIGMQYYDKDHNLVTLTSSNVWEIDGIPEFSFYIDYKGPTIEEAGEQTEGYRDRSYTVSSFDIVALDGYKTEYNLYFLETSAIPEEENFPALYKDLVANLDDWTEKFEKWDEAAGETGKKVLREIKVYDPEITEDDQKWDDTDNQYHWDPDSSLSFIPPVDGTYLVKVTVKDGRLPGVSETAYQAIHIRNSTDTIAGHSKWLENNRTAIILFAISGALLVAIIVISIVLPSEKKVEEVDLATLKGKKEKNKKD